MTRKAPIKKKFQFSTGIPGIDMQHNELFTMCESLLERLEKESPPPDSSWPVVQEILGYMKFHFSTEEILMEMINFPRLAEHKALHKKLETRFSRAETALKSKDNPDIGAFIRRFINAMRAHFLDCDSEYSGHIENLITLKEKFKITALKAQALAGK